MSDNSEVTKKAYVTPELITYGDIEEITQATGFSGTDGGVGGADFS